MTQSQYIINRKLNIVELGKTLGNISEACRKLGVSRQHYYDIKRAIDEEGLEGLLEKSRRIPRIGNRVAPEIEQKLLDYSLEFPTHGQARVSNELRKQDIQISPGGVRSVWLRHNLEVKKLRLKRLEKWAAENSEVLTESQVKALEEAKEEKEFFALKLSSLKAAISYGDIIETNKICEDILNQARKNEWPQLAIWATAMLESAEQFNLELCQVGLETFQSLNRDL